MTTFSLPNDYLFPKVKGNFGIFSIADFCELKNFKISKKIFFSMSLPTQSLECLFTSEEGEGSPASPSLREIFPARNERKISDLLAKQHLQRGDPRCKSFSSDKGSSDCVERDVLK